MIEWVPTAAEEREIERRLAEADLARSWEAWQATIRGVIKAEKIRRAARAEYGKKLRRAEALRVLVVTPTDTPLALEDDKAGEEA